jgi:molybdate transport system ATP-binding protein
VNGTETGLQSSLVVGQGSFRLELDLDVAPGEVVALLGPNGAGKSTALRALTGLTPLTAGSVRLDGRLLDDPRSGIYVATEHRSVGMVFQDYLLFPHLSALDNVAFGLRAHGADRRQARSEALDWLVRVGLVDQASSRPRRLSGGEAQRVALARALVTSPRLLLLDEPLAALDASTRMVIRSDLRRHLADFGGSTVLVTHDPLDAMILADRIVVVEGGDVVQVGSPGEVARAPRTAYVARLLGLNLFRGAADGTQVTLADGGLIHLVDPATGEVFVAFPPSAVTLHRVRPTGASPRNVWSGLIVGLEQHATTVRVQISGQPSLLADVTAAAVAELDLTPGTEVWASVKATETHAYPA